MITVKIFFVCGLNDHGSKPSSKVKVAHNQPNILVTFITHKNVNHNYQCAFKLSNRIIKMVQRGTALAVMPEDLTSIHSSRIAEIQN